MKTHARYTLLSMLFVLSIRAQDLKIPADTLITTSHSVNIKGKPVKYNAATEPIKAIGKAIMTCNDKLTEPNIL